ncbi:farnesyl diphosphate synthase [uncultured Paludibaculum sp.]|uniref:polyprenyl synthetase family protein n=1 Tax=uncultured Paludibaculum sp. TaxID=1765020 RepID=UPI002AAAAA6E|nr:farnesyl diphosphate synthase [uncultured Paludibaculum sp.]
MTLAELSLKEYLAEQTKLIDQELDRLVPAEDTPPAVIHKAMRYSLFAGGKRIRPILCLEAARSVAGRDIEGAVTVSCPLELIHTYSLIHDDLPALDNDDLRRGRPTSHKVFGEAMAILAGDSLLTFAFEVLGRAGNARLVTELAAASGTVRGMIAGQVHDIEGENQTPTAELLEQIHRAKTGALLRCSLRMGAIHAGATDSQLASMSAYGEHIGLAFQIIDDILDVTQTSEELGKTAGKDAEQHKITFPAVYGLEASQKMAEEQRALAHAALEPFGGHARRLHELADLVVDRRS